jgi:hypothetical protein
VSYSCNGFHENAAEKKYGGIAFLWQDLMREHAAKRFHVMVRTQALGLGDKRGGGERNWVAIGVGCGGPGGGRGYKEGLTTIASCLPQS